MENENKDDTSSLSLGTGPGEASSGKFGTTAHSDLSIENLDDVQLQAPGRDLVRDLLHRAAGDGLPPTGLPSGGHNLEGKYAEGSSTRDPNTPASDDQETAIRHLTFWRDGFTFGDGALMRYDNPNNIEVLNEINAGRAPPTLLNVLPGQPVEVYVTKRTTEDCLAPQGTKVFAGSAASKTVPKSKPIAAAPAPKSVTNKPLSEKNANRYGTDEKSPATSAQVGRAASTSKPSIWKNLVDTLCGNINLERRS